MSKIQEFSIPPSDFTIGVKFEFYSWSSRFSRDSKIYVTVGAIQDTSILIYLFQEQRSWLDTLNETTKLLWQIFLFFYPKESRLSNGSTYVFRSTRFLLQIKRARDENIKTAPTATFHPISLPRMSAPDSPPRPRLLVNFLPEIKPMVLLKKLRGLPLLSTPEGSNAAVRSGFICTRGTTKRRYIFSTWPLGFFCSIKRLSR